MTISISFRTNDGGRWGTGIGTDLTPAQVDRNFWNLKTAVETLQADLPAAAVGIDSFEVVSSSFYVHMSDGSTLGPYDLPVTEWNFRGDWLGGVAYFANDVVTSGYGTYLVVRDHTSVAPFDAGANDGEGNNYYSLLIDIGTYVLPSGGTTGQILAKASNTDRDVTWIDQQDIPDPVGDNVMTLTYLSSELIVDGDLATDPLLSFPTWVLNDNAWSVGEITVTFNANNPDLEVPVNNLVIGDWYVFNFEGTITDDLNLITADYAKILITLGGSGAFVFQAASTSDVFTFSLYHFNDYAVRTFTSFSCRKIEQPTGVQITNGNNLIAEFGLGDGNIFMGESIAVDRGVFGSTLLYPHNCIGIGVSSFEHLTVGTESLAIGVAALQMVYGAYGNIALGNYALQQLSGDENIGIGVAALPVAKTADNNIAIGHGIGNAFVNGYDNILIGDNTTAYRLVGGAYNIVIGGGYAAAYMTSSRNVIIGHAAGKFLGASATAEYNTIIGYGADVPDSLGPYNVSNSVALGYNAKVSENNVVQLGNSSVVKAYVGDKAIGQPKHAVVSGAAAGNITVTGINTGDRLDEVIYYPASYDVIDLTTEFTITAGNTINNGGGTSSAGGKLIVRWTKLT